MFDRLPTRDGETVVTVYRAIRWDNTYRDVLDFDNRVAQIAWFAAHAYKTWSQLSPVRPGEAVRLAISADELMLCNYVSWTNGTKIYYGFISGVTYAAANTALCNIEVDVYQSYMFDWQFGDCMVRREHVADDGLYQHLNAEPISYGGEYITRDNYRFIAGAGAPCFVLEASEDLRGLRYRDPTTLQEYPFFCPNEPLKPGPENSRNRTFRGTYMFYWRLQDMTTEGGSLYDGLQYSIQAIVGSGKADAIVSVFTCPLNLLTTTDPSTIDISVYAQPYAKIGSYTPKNKKLFTWPFRGLRLYTPNGGTDTLELERFADPAHASVQVVPLLSSDPCIVVYPLNYQDTSSGSQPQAPGHGVTLSGWPDIPFAIDNYRAFLAQRKLSGQDTLFAIQTAVKAGEAVANIAAGNYGRAIKSGIDIGGSFIQRAGQEAEAKAKPDTIRGSLDAARAAWMEDKNYCYLSVISWPEHMLRVADDYLTRHGYNVSRVGKPLLRSRKRYNFVQTEGASILITSAMPNEAVAALARIFDSGVTIWHNADYIGDYATTNEVR